MPRKKLVINFVLDETGSMGICRDATISGFNEYVNELKKRPESLLFTLTKFNSSKVEVVYAAEPINKIDDLTPETYHPEHNTPLYDAVARTIKATEERLSQIKGKPSVLCVIQTDGQENASKEYTLAQIRDLIDAKTKEGWTFAFLGADQDAWVVGQSIGVPVMNTMSYTGDSVGTKQAMATLGAATTSYADAGAAQMDSLFEGKTDIRHDLRPTTKKVDPTTGSAR